MRIGLDAVIFDLDGTLVETAPDLHRVLVQVLGEVGVPAPSLDSVRHMVGDGARALVERALRSAGEVPAAARLDRLYHRFLDLYTAEPCRESFAFPGVPEALATLAHAGVAQGICTNKPQRPSELLLAALGLAERFGSVIGGDVLPVRKPDPAHLGAVLRALGASPPRSVMVGDSRNDLLSARAVGIPCVLVSFGYTTIPARELGAEAVIDHFEQLPAALRALATPRS
ncbi:MAG TPA: phosphoglycolate phosphatase [Geminicoccaceae bacterium]|nr:phosphoglycolate phosphatase [Geminicoccaceae bacterium]